ncbi:hypothetical protein [Paraliomyxa miuraensis]|uniref:hypothetical protein n=1 Tax=Paraliomyxa miuraensis TaxID=376150 RepID=UPI00225A0D30|nr:hypothetical protein [Paraliomyxa miuraensis]MCX4241752.1 hypothetical protein [Paraliomyxa miuraensis]
MIIDSDEVAVSLDDTLRRLPPAAVEFTREIFDHHWSEASWLYARREVLHVQGHLLSFDQWAELEERTQAHVMALERGGRLVLGECHERATEGDAGELHTAMRVLCRRDEAGALNELVEALPWQEPKRAAAVADALTWDAPPRWQELVAAILEDEQAPEDALGPLATVVGLRRWALGELLLGVLEDRVGDLAATAEAVGRLLVPEALPTLSALVTSDQESRVRGAAITAIACADPRNAVAYLGQVVGTEPWAAVPLALTAGAEALPYLAAAARHLRRPEVLHGLGLLGCTEAIPMLLEALAEDALGEAAAEALYLITGAPLHEETRLVDDADEGDGDDENDESAGLLAMRLPTSPERWKAWIDTQGPACLRQAGARARLGVPYDPFQVLEELGRTTLRPELREAMAVELSIRYRVPQRYSTRLLVTEQRRAIGQLRELLRGLRIEPGSWVFEGRPLRSMGTRTRPR